MREGNRGSAGPDRATLATVTPAGKRTAQSAEEWLLDRSHPSERESADVELKSDGDTAKWIAEPTASLNGDTGNALPSPFTRAPKSAEEALEEQRTENTALAELVEQLQSAEAELRSRIEQLESQLADANQGDAEPKEKPEEKPKESGPRRRRKAGRTDGKPNVNSVTFEDLRDLGLSVTQSARVIAYRDVRDGYESLDELDEVPGLPKTTRRALRDQLAI
jgi:DNA uptake protein ComE-like DNA-binding protein